MKSRLFKREWVVLAIAGGVISTLCWVAWFPLVQVSKKKLSLHEPHAGWIELRVSGAVKRPGLYRFPPGVTLSVVAKEAGLTREADRKRLDRRKTFYGSQEVFIEKKE